MPRAAAAGAGGDLQPAGAGGRTAQGDRHGERGRILPHADDLGHFHLALGFADLAGPTLGFLIGGVAAAPFGAYAAKHFSTKLMLILAGLVLTVTSAYGVYNALSWRPARRLEAAACEMPRE